MDGWMDGYISDYDLFLDSFYIYIYALDYLTVRHDNIYASGSHAGFHEKSRVQVQRYLTHTSLESP